MAVERSPDDWRERAAAVRDPALPPVRVRRDLLNDLYEHARECYREECCGLMLGPRAGVPDRVVRCTNVQSRRLARGESHLDAGHGFYIDERELLRAQESADREGLEILAIYHSHPDTEAYLSKTDLECALGPAGRPLYPGAAQLVLSVRDGIVGDAVWFEWSERQLRYVGRGVEAED